MSGVNTAADGPAFIFEPSVSEVGDPGVLIPDLQIGASVWASLPAGLEFGGQVYYAAMDWADPNTAGVLPFPREEETDLLMGGIGLRFNTTVGDVRSVLAITAEVNLASIPEAIFLCTDEERCRGGFSGDFEGRELYTFDRVERETFFLPNLALQYGWRFGDLGSRGRVHAQGDALGDDGAGGVAEEDDGARVAVMPYVALGLQSSVTNTGFESDLGTLPEDSLEALWVGSLSLGVDARIDAFVVGLSLLLPFESEEAIDFGAVFDFRIGVQL